MGRTLDEPEKRKWNKENSIKEYQVKDREERCPDCLRLTNRWSKK